MTTMTAGQKLQANLTYIASLGRINVTEGADTSEFRGQCLQDIFVSAINGMCEMLEQVSDESAAAVHAEEWLCEMERQGHADINEHEQNLPLYVKHVLDNDMYGSGVDYAENLRDAAFELHYDDEISDALKSSINFLAKANVKDELGTLDALRAGVQFDHLFAL